MLNLRHHPQTDHLYLTVRNDFARAWIEHYPRLGDSLERLGEIPDWRLWVAPPGRPASRQKSPTRLLIESQLPRIIHEPDVARGGAAFPAGPSGTPERQWGGTIPWKTPGGP